MAATQCRDPRSSKREHSEDDTAAETTDEQQQIQPEAAYEETVFAGEPQAHEKGESETEGTEKAGPGRRASRVGKRISELALGDRWPVRWLTHESSSNQASPVVADRQQQWVRLAALPSPNKILLESGAVDNRRA
ncbi:MAG: hypothetical protein GEU93_05955 [Propionibacteriales bacterium]|nr:hypothetical protein [Propionibacteriales bacterium]